MDWTKPTTQLLGRFQPWHKGHTELFKRAIDKTGQVAILLRASDGSEGNPYDFDQRAVQITTALAKEGFYSGEHYIICNVPNISHITYGRDVGYTIEQEKLDNDVEAISATNIRKGLQQIAATHPKVNG